MTKYFSMVAFIAASFGLTGCGATGQALLNDILNNMNTELQNSGETSTAANILGSVLGAVTTSSAVTNSDLSGTWTYNGTKVYFESENALAQIGGQVAATEVESKLNTQLSKVGFTQSACKFTFYPQSTTSNTGTFEAYINSKKISGNYTLDESEGKLTLSVALGLGNVTCYVTRNGTSTLNLVFPSNKLLQIAQVAGSLSGGSALSSVSSLLGNYDGMQIGLKLYKQSK
ncbi:MAG: DUF4923 family protein [Alloprevotella sp.]|nr:DUF4923 family protein [Alloprevotella sp.]